MSEYDEGSIDDLAAAYALDALSPAERSRFEAEASPEAIAEAQSFAETAANIAADEATPSPFLRAGLLDAIARTPQLPAVDADLPLGHNVVPLRPSDDRRRDKRREPFAVSGEDGGATAVPTRAEVRARARWRPMRAVVGFAAGAALFAGGIALGSNLDRGDSDAEALGAIISASDAERSDVELANGGQATVVWSDSQGRTAIVFDDLVAAPAGNTYQAWYIDGEGARSAGVFAGDRPAVVLEGDLSIGASVGVTVEPAGGSEAPTTDPMFVVET